MSSSEDSSLRMSTDSEKFVSCFNFYSSKDSGNNESGKEAKKVNIDEIKTPVGDINKSSSVMLGLDSLGQMVPGKSKEDIQQSIKTALNSECVVDSNIKQDKLVNFNFSKKLDSFSNSFERLVGLNIINPVLTMDNLRAKLEGRKLITFDKLKNHCKHGDLNDDWVVVGAVCSQSNSTAKTGSKFSVWTISDLKLGLNLASLFLFGESHTRLWKHSVGTVVGVLNPSVMESKSNKTEASLSVNNADRVMILGQSKDLGFCSAKNNKGGTCNSVINKYRSEYCLFHFRNNNSKSSKNYTPSGGRLSLQNKVIGKGEVFYAGQSFTAKKSTTQKKNVKTERFNEKDKDTLKKLFESSDMDFEFSPQSASVKKVDMELTRYKKIKDAELLNRLSNSGNSNTKQNEGSTSKGSSTKSESVNCNYNERKSFSRESLINFFDKKSTGASSKSNNIGKLSNSEKIVIDLPAAASKKSDQKTNEMYISRSVTPKGQKSNQNVQKSSIKEKDTLKKLFCKKDSESPVQDVEIESDRYKRIKEAERSKTLAKTENSTNNNDTKENNKTEETSSGFSRKSLNNYFDNKPAHKTSNNKPAGGLLSNLSNAKILIDLPTTSVRREGALAKMKALDYVNKHGPFKKRDLSKNYGQNPAKRQKVISEIKDPAIENVESPKDKCSSDEQSVMSARFIELMNMTSKHKDLLDDADQKFMEEYFSKMSKKEDMEVVMLHTFKVPCKAVRCIKCRYTWFSAADFCKTENHPIVTINATKRFFSCDDCGNRTVCLTILPLQSCKKCGSMSWKRAPILNLNKTVANLNDLSIRGGEQKFVNSVETNTSLNLLVPD